MTTLQKTRFENAQPILRISSMSVSVRYYVDVLGFKNAPKADQPDETWLE